MSNTPRDDSTIESKIYKTDKEVVNSEDFEKGFTRCLNKMENLENKDSYLEILAKIKLETEVITYDEYKKLEDLLDNNDFKKLANKTLNSIKFTVKRNENFNEFKKNISIESLKSYLINNVYTRLIANATQNIIGIKTNEIFEPRSKSYEHLQTTGLLQIKGDHGTYILVDKNGVEIDESVAFFYRYDHNKNQFYKHIKTKESSSTVYFENQKQA